MKSVPSKESIKIFRETHGAMSVAEGIALYNICKDAPNGNWVELGTHKGKSSIMIALSIAPQTELHLVEPEFTNYEWRNNVLDLIGRFLPENGLALHASYSTDVLPMFDKISFCFVDSGSHQDGLPMQEVKLLEDRVVQGGIIAFHDWNSQFKEVKEASDYLVSTGKYEYIDINWNEIVKYVDDNDLETNNLSWHHQELKNPCFVGAVRRL